MARRGAVWPEPGDGVGVAPAPGAGCQPPPLGGWVPSPGGEEMKFTRGVLFGCSSLSWALWGVRPGP